MGMLGRTILHSYEITLKIYNLYMLFIVNNLCIVFTLKQPYQEIRCLNFHTSMGQILVEYDRHNLLGLTR